MLQRSHPEVAEQLLEEAEDDVQRKWRLYSEYASGHSVLPGNAPSAEAGSVAAAAALAGPKG